MKNKVFKFGGASIKDADSIRNVGEIVKKNYSSDLILVVSALGKTTNALEEIVNAYYFKKENVETLFQILKEKHFTLLKNLFPENHDVFDEVNNCFVEIDWILEDEPLEAFDYIYDQIVSIGEMASTRIVTAYLNHIGIKTKWIDARDLIRTDNTFREGKVDWEKSEKMIQHKFSTRDAGTIYLTQGFLGGTSENFTTTLGREGSDYTAAILAHCLDTESVTIWKDVDGVLNADPRYFSDVRKIDELSWYEVIEMAYYGATVIHPKTIKPLENKNIPLYVKSFLKPEQAGTKIFSGANTTNLPPLLVMKPEQTLLSISPKDFSFIAEDNLSFIFNLFSEYGIKVNLMQNAAISFSTSIDFNSSKVENCIQHLAEKFKVLRNDNLQLLTVRHYTDEVINKLTAGKTILLEQKSRHTIQLVVR